MTKYKKLVVVESPFAGNGNGNIGENIKYARRCVMDCLKRGESPIASHLLLTQPGVLNDRDDKERKLGINAGHQWLRVADASVVYTDKGVSRGMVQGIKEAERLGVEVEYRTLEEQWR